MILWEEGAVEKAEGARWASPLPSFWQKSFQELSGFKWGTLTFRRASISLHTSSDHPLASVFEEGGGENAYSAEV